jgi:hypothetical protein
VDELLDHLTENHSAPGAFVAGVMWFRFPEGNPITYYANEKKPDPADRFAKPITILWPDKDPLFPPEWSDNLSDFYRDFTLHFMKNVGHFSFRNQWISSEAQFRSAYVTEQSVSRVTAIDVSLSASTGPSQATVLAAVGTEVQTKTTPSPTKKTVPPMQVTMNRVGGRWLMAKVAYVG